MHFKIPWFFLRLAAVDLDDEGFLRMQSTAEITKKTKTRAPPTANNIARIGVTLNRECPFPTLPPPSRVNAFPPDSSKWSGTLVVKALSRTGTLRPNIIESNECNDVIWVLFSARGPSWFLKLISFFTFRVGWVNDYDVSSSGNQSSNSESSSSHIGCIGNRKMCFRIFDLR